jgi:predicted 3-demethylubiquinone-9 3-methyltransferase (glyoxalase superfamily)
VADSRVLSVNRAPDGRVTTVTFELAGQRCVAFDGGPQFSFTGAMSLYATCDTQDEVDRIWAGLVDGGEEGPGGSLTDRFGVTWLDSPHAVGDLLDGAEPDAAERVLTALHGMTKINIQELADARAR